MHLGGEPALIGVMTDVVPAPMLDELESVYRDEGARLWRALIAYSGSPDVADEAVAEAFAQAVCRGSAIRQPDRWVWKAAFRLAAGDLKRRRLRVPLHDSAVVHNPEPAWDLIDALGRLPRRQRMCLVLCYYGGYPSKDIARIVGSTPAAVRMQLSRGRRRLAVILGGGTVDG